MFDVVLSYVIGGGGGGNDKKIVSKVNYLKSFI